MGSHAQLNSADMRNVARVTVEYRVPAKHRWLGEVQLQIQDVSPFGMMIRDKGGVGRGDRLNVALPVVGATEVFCLWTRYQDAGLLFGRPLSEDEFRCVIHAMRAERKTGATVRGSPVLSIAGNR